MIIARRIALVFAVLASVATAEEPVSTDITMTQEDATALVMRFHALNAEIKDLQAALAAAKLKSGCI